MNNTADAIACEYSANKGNEAHENTDTLVLNLCKSLGADVAIGEIDRSHRTGKPEGR